MAEEICPLEQQNFCNSFILEADTFFIMRSQKKIIITQLQITDSKPKNYIRNPNLKWSS